MISTVSIQWKIVRCIQNIIGTNSYTNESAKEWARTIVDNCRSDLVKLGKPFKYIVNCTITQKPGSGVYSASSCYWDTGKDGEMGKQSRLLYCRSVCNFSVIRYNKQDDTTNINETSSSESLR
uniref:Dynein light chain Tctex-type 3 n=1 Tax=Schistosoma haematobium TaxID=6185 RepID=A0A094ZGQ8_SCHHA